MSCFIAHLNCPLCEWGSVASAPTYAEAEERVSAELLDHLAQQHPEAAELPEPKEVATLPAAG